MDEEMIYIAAPYWHEKESVREQRRQKVIAYSMMLTRRGVLNYSPLLYSERYKKTKVPEQYWIEHGLRMVDVCDVIRVLCLDGRQESSGIKGEVARAEALGRKVEYLEQHVRLAFCGSRSLGNDAAQKIIAEAIQEYQPETIITHGEPEGVCALARQACKEYGIPLKTHYLQLKRAAGKFHHRSRAVFEDCDYCVFIHDGVSTGCSNELEIAKEMQIPYDYHLLKPAEQASSKSTGSDEGLLDVGSFAELEL